MMPRSQFTIRVNRRRCFGDNHSERILGHRMALHVARVVTSTEAGLPTGDLGRRSSL
jgi:hypothetical protein